MVANVAILDNGFVALYHINNVKVKLVMHITYGCQGFVLCEHVSKKKFKKLNAIRGVSFGFEISSWMLPTI